MLSLAHPGIKRIPILLLLATILLSFVGYEEAEAATKTQRVERRLMNQERRPETPVVRLDRGLSRIARRHSRRMARAGSLHHNPNLVDQVGDRQWERLGENVGVVGATGDLRETLDMLHGAFMNSDAHRRNILHRPYRKIGVGLVRNEGLVWVTVVFLG